MNIFLIIGLVIGFGGVLAGYMLDGGVLISLLKPTSASIVFGGTIGYILISFPQSYLKQVLPALKLILFKQKRDYFAIIDQLYELANIARKNGILSMEGEAQKVTDPFMKRGLLYVAEGVEPEYLRTVLEHEVEASSNKFEQAAKVMGGAGGVSPAMGVLGTVMGMVSILRSMGSDMSALGAKIATAFIATMYGVGSANLIWLPLSEHIKNYAAEEEEYFSLIIEGLLNILEGEYPNKMKESLLAKIGKADNPKEGKKGRQASEAK